MKPNEMSDKKSFPSYGWLGFGLIITFWALNWTLTGLRTHWGFFPLWLGYCLTVDALVFIRKGDSLLTRNPRAYAGLFLISIGGWWLFEFINWRTQNWAYEGMEFFTSLEYDLYASLSFSTVMPAVFGTAELVSTLDWVRRKTPRWEIAPHPRTTLITFFTGIAMFALMMVWPRYFFPFVWLSVYFIMEPVNVWLGHRSLVSYVSQGDWRPVIGLGVGCLICGFFWEMWNYYSYPKWVYNVPFLGFARVFEMPILGYGGYLPFSLELFALYHLVIGLFKSKNLYRFIQVVHDV